MHRYLLALCLLAILSSAASASVTAPPNIVAYVPITLTNSQSSAFAYNSQVMITVNSLAYESYEANNLGNVEFFYSNSTLVPSWLMGDSAGAGSYLSTNTVYWLRIYPANTFLAAGSSNTLYMGFATTGTNLFNGNSVGESPYASPSYAQYDNGANVFVQYFNMESNPIAFSQNGLASYYTLSSNKGPTGSDGHSLIFSPNGVEQNIAQFTSTSNYPSQFIVDSWVSTDAAANIQGVGAGNSLNLYDGYVISAGENSNADMQILSITGNTSTEANEIPFAQSPSTWYNFEFQYKGSGNMEGIISPWTYSLQPNSLDSNTVTATNTLYQNLDAIELYPGGQQSDYQAWAITLVRTYPPNDMMPSATFGQPVSLAVAPTISLASAITPNAIDVVAGSHSDNSLITATCASGDTCAIYNLSGNELASGTTTAILAYNALPIGYSTLHANDITDGMASGPVSVRRVAVLSSIPYTFVNSAKTPFSANTSLSIDFNALANRSIESNSLNNTLIYFKNGTVAYSWIEGNQLNQFAPGNLLYGATNVIIWFKSPPSNAFLPADTNGITTATVYLGFSGTSNNLLDGNFTGEAPYLSQQYAQYDNGANVFELYFNGDTPVNSFTVGSNFTLTQASGVTLGSEVVNALQVEGACTYGYPCLSYVYNKGAPNNPTILQAAVANNNEGHNLASIDIQNGNTVDSSNTDVEAVYSGYSGAGFSLAYIQLGHYAANLDSQGQVSTSLDFYTVYYHGSSNSSFSGSISPTLYSGGYNGSQNINPLASDNTLYIGDGIGNNPKTPTNAFIEFARALVPTPPGESSSSYKALDIAAPSPSSQSVTQGQNAIINDSGLSGGKAPYSYQWYASASGVPGETAANALEANTLLGIGTASGEAQSQNALFATSSNTAAGTYYFSLYGTDSEQVTVNTSAAVVTVQGIPTTTVGAGGGPPGPSYISISDNINSAAASSAPVFLVDSTQYYQNQLPAEAQFTGPYAYVRFACNVTIGSSVYYYQNDAYGLGGGAICNHAYQTNVGSIEAIYAPGQNTTSSTTLSTTTETSTIPTTTVLTTTIIQPTTTTISSYASNISVSANSPAQLNVTPFMNLKISSSNQSNQNIRVLVGNQTSQSTAPANYSKIYVFTLNATPQTNIAITATIAYNCSLNPGVVPFAYVNGTWQQIYGAVVLQNPCRISFPDKNGHLVGIFEKSLAQANSTTPAKLSTSSAPQYPPYLGIAIVVILIILILLAYRRRKKQHKR